MGRLLAVLADRPLPFLRWLRAVRESSPSLPEDQFEMSTAAVCATDAGWDLVGDATSMASAPPGVALVAHVRARFTAAAPGSRVLGSALVRHGDWVFAHDGTIEDFSYLIGRTSAARRATTKAEGDGALLLAFILSRIDERTTPGNESLHTIDHAVAAGASELGRRIGSFSFVLSNGRVLYAYRFDRALHFVERQATATEPSALLVASEPLTREPWLEMRDRTLLAGRRTAAGVDVRFLTGFDPRNAISDVELPFTD